MTQNLQKTGKCEDTITVAGGRCFDKRTIKTIVGGKHYLIRIFTATTNKGTHKKQLIITVLYLLPTFYIKAFEPRDEHFLSSNLYYLDIILSVALKGERG